MRSMRLFLLLSFVALMLLEAYGLTNETDRQALLEFKSQVSQGKRVVLSSWNHSLPLCKWYGVTCGRKHKRVTRLDLAGLQLGGVISPSIGNLSFLMSLDLFNNSLGGTIPQEVGNLFRLESLYMGYNSLGGRIPSEIGSLTKLVGLDLGRNKLRGKLPVSLGNLTSLTEVVFLDNMLEGEIPDDMGRLTQLVTLYLGTNKFSGVFPPSIYNMSSLKGLYINDNHFSGSLRPDFGNLLPNLQVSNMGRNYLTGAVPATLANLSSLEKLAIDNNNLTGKVPLSFGKARNLQYLGFHSNSLGSGSFGDLEFLGPLANCTNLQFLDVSENKLGGDLPATIANLSTNLISLSLAVNHISGSIPHDIVNLISLQRLSLGGNMLTGPIPTSLGKLSNLGGLSLSSNRMSREIPVSLGNITQLGKLYLFNNGFEGMVPPSLGNCSYLQDIQIGHNKLYGTIPREIMQIPTLLALSIPHNSLSGSLPKDVGQSLVTLSVEHNRLSEKLPQGLGKCLSMEKLYLQGNFFDGEVPDIGGLVGVKRLDLSENNLSGSIPEYFANFPSLEYLNLSSNSFEGRVPTEGKFQNATIVLVYGNKDLCGGIKELKLKPCIAQAPPLETKHSSRLKKVAIGLSVGITLLLLSFIALAYLRWFRKRKKNQQDPSPSTLGAFYQTISYGDLRNATDGFSSSNMVGSGSFGTVFKALLPTENKVVAVKVLNMQRRGAMKSFLAECESLKDIRHRKLVKLLTACSSIDFKGNEFRALIYEFMPNGSLDMWLHQEEVEEIQRPSRTLTLLERLNIAIDVASVLDYLHVHCHEPIAHCDLKPSNVLLDDDLAAHVSDFGLARVLLKFDKDSFLNQLSSAGVRGTIGYAAPEYGIGGEPSIHGDVYSFGVLILEMFTGKRPTNELFGGNFTLHSFTKSALPERVLDIADETIFQTGGLRVGFPIVECLTLVLEVGLRCSEESPTNRLATSEAAKELILIKERFFKARRTTRR